MTALTGIQSLDFAAARITVEAGVSIATLARTLLPSGWFLPVTPGTSFVTVGGAIANDVHGKNQFTRGSFCNHVRSFDLLTTSRGLVTVDREVEPDLFQATCGGLGLTGIILRATLDLSTMETPWMVERVERLENLEQLLEAMASDDLNHDHALAWIDGLARGRHLGRSVLSRARHAGRDEVPPGHGATTAACVPERSWPRFGGPVSGCLFRRALPAVNRARFLRAASRPTHRLVPLSRFLFPLDRVPGWNRLFGRGGLIQYQFVVPFGREQTIRAVLERLSRNGPPSALTSLKRFGAGSPLLSFPRPGWCLAVDLPGAHPGLAGVLQRFDEIVAEAGGRVYLAKDSRLSPDAFEAMYPEASGWRAIADAVDPEHVMMSDMARRLHLKGQ